MRASSGSTSAGVVSQGNHVRLEDCPFLPLTSDLYPEQATGHLQRAVLQVPEQREG